MAYNPKLHHRHSIRLKDYDYSQEGLYFITLCTQNRLDLFGEIINGEMILNNAGIMIEKVWNEIPQFYSDFEIDFFVVMPNHIHGILHNVGAGSHVRPNMRHNESETGQSQGNALTLSLFDIVCRFKSFTTHKYIIGVKQHGWIPFPGKVWQRDYYEHVIRNEKELFQYRNYIQNNPLNWENDEENFLRINK